MSRGVAVLIGICAVALLALQQALFDRDLRKARRDRTGAFRLPLRTRRAIVVAVVVASVVIALWQLQPRP